MRASRSVPLAASLAVGLAAPASAIPTVSVKFGGASTITVTSSSAVVTASVFLDLTAAPFGASGVSVDVDFDSAGQNVLDFVGGTELLPTGYLFNLTPGCCDDVTESALGVPGSVFGVALEAWGFTNVRGGELVLIGTLQFHVTGEFGTTDVMPSFGPDGGVGFDSFLYGTVNLVGGTAHHPIPEPGTAALLALGLGVLVAARGPARR